MTSLPERIISVIAPHHCFSCGKEGNSICAACFEIVFGEGLDVCFLCNKPTVDSMVCGVCAKQTALQHVWIAASYDGVVKRIIRAYKFERVRAAHKPLAEAMTDRLPYLEDVVVVHVPTAASRVRQRGYDHSLLLARVIARQRNWRHIGLLRRRHGLRQVGSSRIERTLQAASAFELNRSLDVAGRHVLLVDDVTTSGATLMAAAELIKQAGAACIDAVVVAKHTLD